MKIGSVLLRRVCASGKIDDLCSERNKNNKIFFIETKNKRILSLLYLKKKLSLVKMAVSRMVHGYTLKHGEREPNAEE